MAGFWGFVGGLLLVSPPSRSTFYHSFLDSLVRSYRLLGLLRLSQFNVNYRLIHDDRHDVLKSDRVDGIIICHKW